LSQNSPTLVARFFYFLNNVVALATGVSYVAWFVNPKYVAAANIAALAVPGLIVANAVFILIWLIFYRRYVWLSLITIGLGWWHINALIGINEKTVTTEETFRVMSYNVRNFRYTWPGKIPKDNPGMVAITDSLKPDILCMQEFMSGGNWVPKFKFKHKYIPLSKGFSLAIYTNYRIINKGAISYGVESRGYNKFIFADVIRGSDTIRIINTHLMSIGLEETDFRTFTNIDIEQLDEEQLTQSSKNIVKRLMAAAPIRGVQVEAVANFIELSPYPVILCGDLNDTPTTYTFRKLTKKLNDTFRQAGSGFGTTHPKFAKYHLPLRIDHILVGDAFSATKWRTVESDLSDHFAVYADLIVAE
jgi:endonuclease/exonuclease/phosphatase family metal-dependent hydrolase